MSINSDAKFSKYRFNLSYQTYKYKYISASYFYCTNTIPNIVQHKENRFKFVFVIYAQMKSVVVLSYPSMSYILYSSALYGDIHRLYSFQKIKI